MDRGQSPRGGQPFVGGERDVLNGGKHEPPARNRRLLSPRLRVPGARVQAAGPGRGRRAVCLSVHDPPLRSTSVDLRDGRDSATKLTAMLSQPPPDSGLNTPTTTRPSVLGVAENPFTSEMPPGVRARQGS